MHGNSMHGNQEIPVLPAALRKQRAGGGNPQGHASHVRRREVGLPRSACESSEQGRPLRGDSAEEPEGRRQI
jgi:hypothetical protein